MSEIKQDNRQEKVNVLNYIMPRVRETFEKRKKVEALKAEIRESKRAIKVRKDEIKALAALSQKGDRIESVLKKEVEMLKEEIQKKKQLQASIETEISIDECSYKAQGKLVKGICLKQEEVKDAALMLYFMWVSKMKKDDLFEAYFETTKNLSRTNGSLKTNLISSELNNFPYDEEFEYIFNYQAA